MPTIPRLPRKPDRRPKRGRNKLYYNLLNTSQWRNLRAAYLAVHPLCQDCELEGKATMSEEVHHVTEILSGETIEEMAALAYDPTNLRALCRYHHHLIHNKLRVNK